MAIYEIEANICQKVVNYEELRLLRNALPVV